LLSTNGTVVQSNQQLLARFHPVNADKDYGLDALYVWPSGEIWFSTEDHFDDSDLGSITSGDLLSDQGYIVFRNLELLDAFAPTNAPSDVGLDALYVVTDATPPSQAPRLAIQINTATGSADLSWQGQGRVFRVERAAVKSHTARSLLRRSRGVHQPLPILLPTPPVVTSAKGDFGFRHELQD
jgi:hypothetical protein